MVAKATGKGSGRQRHLPVNPGNVWSKKSFQEALLAPPPWLTRFTPLMRSKAQQEASDLLTFTSHPGKRARQAAGWATAPAGLKNRSSKTC